MIDWQLQLVFDNYLRFLYIQTFFISTTVCSSACRRCERLIVAVTFVVHIFCCLQLLHVLAYMQQQPFIYTSKFLPITVVFACLLHISSLGFAVIYLHLHLHLMVVFQRFCSSISGISCSRFKTFCCRFSVFQQLQCYLLYICFVPTLYISTSGSYIACTYRYLYCSLIYCSNFLMVSNEFHTLRKFYWYSTH